VALRTWTPLMWTPSSLEPPPRLARFNMLGGLQSLY
jgi:hypothetical protein